MTNTNQQLLSVAFIHNTDGENTAVGPQATSPEKEEEKPKRVEPQRKPSSKASERQSKRSSPVNEGKQSSPVNEEKQSDSESERLQLPAIRPQSVASGTKSPYLSSVKVTTPKGESSVLINILYKPYGSR